MTKFAFVFVCLNLAAAIACSIALPARAHEFRYTAYLSGTAESPTNASPATGHVVVTLDLDLATMLVEAEFDGLLGTVTAAHIHAPTAAAGVGTADVATQVPSFPGFPSGVTIGSYDEEFDLAQASSYNPAFITAAGGAPGFEVSAAMNALIFALDDGKAYFDIHTTAYSDGEIRGFLSYLPGDFNDDGSVDATDFIVWRKSNGAHGDGLAADANNDFVIDGLDYAIWRQNFGRVGLSMPPGSGAVSTSTIPEPRTLTLAALALLAPTRRVRPS